MKTGRPAGSPSVEERFLARLDKGDGTGCWIFTGTLRTTGYGPFMADGVRWAAHRMAWTLWRGDIPSGQRVLHRCDVPACCNPDHLFLGTSADNSADMVAKGRSARAEQNSQTKLSAEKVAAIRADPRSGRKLAAALGLGETTVRDVRRGRTWKHT